MQDYRDIEREFAQRFQGRLTRRPSWVPNDPNFMTSEVLGYVQLGSEVVEVSTGVFLDDRMFGVTFPPSDDDQRSCCVFSLEAVSELLAEPTADQG